MVKRILSEQRHEQQVSFIEQTAPATPPTGYVYVYAKSDGKVYCMDDTGTERVLTGGGGGSLSFEQGIEESTGVIKLGGTIDELRNIIIDTGGALQIDTLAGSAVDIQNGRISLREDIMEITADGEMRVVTPNISSATNGDFLKLVDKTTGEVEYDTPAIGGDPFGTISVVTANTTLSTEQVVLVDTSSATANIVVSLPDPASTPVGRKYLIAFHTGGSGFAPEIDCVAVGAFKAFSQPLLLTNENRFVWLINDGLQWNIVNDNKEYIDYITNQQFAHAGVISGGMIAYSDGANDITGTDAIQVKDEAINLDAAAMTGAYTAPTSGMSLYDTGTSDWQKRLSSIDSLNQPIVYASRDADVATSRWRPLGSSTTAYTFGYSPTLVGTATAETITATSIYTQTPRVAYRVTTAAATAIASWREATATMNINKGFYTSFIWGQSTGTSNTTKRAFAGMRAITTAPTDVNPATLVNCIGMGWDESVDSDVQIYHNDGSGTCTKVSTGFTIPTADATSIFRIEIYVPYGSTDVQIKVKDIYNQQPPYYYTANTDLPAVGTNLAQMAYTSVGGTSAVTGLTVFSANREILLDNIF